LQEALAASHDIWGELAMRQPNGPNFEFFAKRLPPLRYVNTEFRHYPILLSAPNAKYKARLTSNGSALNALAKKETWHDVGLPVSFLVGADRHPFGSALSQLTGPHYAKGYLPIVQMEYREGGSVYRQEVFASIVSPFAPDSTTVFVRFSLRAGKSGQIAAAPGRGKMRAVDGFLQDEQGQGWVWHDANWQWNESGQRLETRLRPGQSAVLAVFCAGVTDVKPPPLDAAVYQAQRRQCADYWQNKLQTAAQIVTPEPYVNAAYRSLLIGTLLLTIGDTPNYSAQNIYETTFQAECGDAVRALLLYGIPEKGRLVANLLQRPSQTGLDAHDTAFKLQLLAHYYRLTGDKEFVLRFRTLWEKDALHFEGHLDAKTGLTPPESYCGDIAKKVFQLSANANLWRGLRDMAVVLEELQEHDAARPLREAAERLRKNVLAAAEASIRKDVTPPFVPIALFGEEKPYEQLTASMEGSYWNLMAPFVLGSGVFGVRSEEARWILDTIQTRGGLCMGLTRFHQHSGLFANENGVDDLYGLRYVLELLQRDEVDRALTSFYGKLAQGMTRDTFIDGEGTGLEPLDAQGRPLYLPPDSAGNAFFLWMLRYLLLQDWDDNNDGSPETLHLLFATPRDWLRDGAVLKIAHAPTAFGPVSVTLRSHLARGEITAVAIAPPTPPKSMQIRFRLPEGWQAMSAQVNGKPCPFDKQNTLDLSGARKRFVIRLRVQKRLQ
jgi:hypothetical protein